MKRQETKSLATLWEYCQENPASRVIYMHSKGSFHDNAANRRLRQVLTRAALSKECATVPIDQCNVCSLRLSPYPHMHRSGNMWAAQCSYVRQLVAPNRLADKMGDKEDWCRGSGRFASEHWVHSHPASKPCDLYTKQAFTWGYRGVPSLGEFESASALASTPRFNESVYRKKAFCRGQYKVEVPLSDFRNVHNMTPSEDWWGWKWYTTE